MSTTKQINQISQGESDMLNYAETLKFMEQQGWSRVHESNTHVFFVKRLSNGNFARKTVEYKR